jgi:hypothetical protein
MSSSALGPYQRSNSLGSAIAAQQTDISLVNTTDGVRFVWRGDRWQSAPDGLKGHDFSYFGMLTIDPKDKSIAPLTFEKQFIIEMP